MLRKRIATSVCLNTIHILLKDIKGTSSVLRRWGLRSFGDSTLEH